MERLIVTGLTRRYHGIDARGREILAATEPALTNTVWDALLAATIEHACRIHGDEVPGWTQKPERFLTDPWTFSRITIHQGDTLTSCPAAFIRHNILIAPDNLDPRGGEVNDWLPDKETAGRAV